MPEHGMSPWKHLVAGGSAGVIEICMMYPTDVLKTRAQLSKTSASMLSVFRSIVDTQGIRGLYRGIASPILAEAPKRAWKFSANEEFKRQFQKLNPDKSLSLGSLSASGALAGLSEAIINCPFETVKVRMQSKEFVSKVNGTYDCLKYLLKNEGITSIYKGLEAQMWRNFFWNGVYFGVIGYMDIQKKKAPKSAQSTNKTFDKFISGCIGSSLGTLANTPFDVVKSRMQLQSTVDGQPVKYRNTFQGLTVVYQEEGFRALYKGLGARLLRLGPGGGIMIVVFDFVANLLKDL